MSPQENKNLVSLFYEEVMNRKDLAAIDKFCAPNFVDRNPGPGQAPGLEGVKQMFRMFTAAFPDFHVSVEDQIAEGDKVVCRVSMRGTHKGEFMGIAPTGKQITVSGIDIIRLSGDKAIERWGNFDDLGMMQQLGAIPSK